MSLVQYWWLWSYLQFVADWVIKIKLIKKLGRSVEICPLNLVLFFVIFFLYHFNDYFLKQHTHGAVQYLCKNHLNDFMGGILFVAYTNLILLTRNQLMYRLWHIVLFCLCVGLFWEFVTPLFHRESVADWIDVCCYVLGGIVYWLMLRIRIKKRRITARGL